MGRIEEAKEILQALGVPQKTVNDRSARVLLALAHIDNKTPWQKATNSLIRIHDIIIFITEKLNFQYAENSRETIRRQSIHKFEQAGIIVRNADDPARPTNSGLTVYSITPEALKVMQKYKTKQWESSVKNFLKNSKSLAKKYSKERMKHFVSIQIDDKRYKLSPGKHNKLQKDILEHFIPRFAEYAEIVYIGDTAHKQIYTDNVLCKELKIDLCQHDKLPDIILYQKEKNWLYLIEAVTTHGPFSQKRIIEIQEMMENIRVELIFVSAFPDFKTFLKYANEIAWETEVWLSNNPNHMIHFNGDKFLGPIT